MQQKILISRSYPLKRQENIEIMPFYVDYKGLLIYMVTRMVAKFVSSGRTRLFIGEIHIHGAGKVGKGALSGNLRPRNFCNIMKSQVFCHDRCVLSTWNDGMVDYWNSWYQKLKVLFFLPPHHSIIPIF